MNSFFTIDVEPDLHSNTYKGITEGIPKILSLLNKYKIKATFFVTCDCIEKYPEVFKKLIKEDHEIALHGYRHVRFDELTYKEKEENIKKSIECFKKYLKIKPKGFRAPQHSIDKETLFLLKKYKFEYDSSKTPLNLMLLRHFFLKEKKKEIILNFFSNLYPYKTYFNMLEIPRTSLLFSIGGFEIKLYPKFLYNSLINLFKIFKFNFVFVMHSWDMIYILNSKTNKLCKNDNFYKKLDNFLLYSIKKTNYIKIEDFLKKQNEKTKNS